MVPILCAFAMVVLLAGFITFCAVIGGYQHPDEWWGEAADPEIFRRVQATQSPSDAPAVEPEAANGAEMLSGQSVPNSRRPIFPLERPA